MTLPPEVSVADLRPAIVNILVHRNDGWTIPFQFKPGGNPTDITNYTIKAQIREDYDDEEAIELTVDKLAGTDGRFTVSQTAAGLTGYYDIELTPPSPGTKRTYIAGKISVSKDVTRA